MSKRVDENWWQHIFDDLYLLTDARSVCNEELTRQEVDFLVENIVLEKNAQILDLCGGHGRHSLELSRRGFKNVTVLDYSGHLVDLGARKAGEEGLNIDFIQGDARDTGLPASSFGVILIMASSFGYFENEEENRKILEEAFRLLAPQGLFLLDLPDRDFVMRGFRPVSEHKVNEDITVKRTRELADDIIYSREVVSHRQKGRLRDVTYCTRLYSSESITQLLQSAGFSSVACYNNFMDRQSLGDFGSMTNRMVVIGRKSA
jgi:D-alanine-D-alanine ligase